MRAAIALLLLSAGAGADQTLLGLCATIDQARCSTATPWTVSKVATVRTLTNPANATAGYTVTVTEGATFQSLTVSGALSLAGTIPSGTAVQAIYLNIQKSDGMGGYTNIAGAGVGDLTYPCECPLVASGQLSVAARDAAGNSVPLVPGALLPSLNFGDSVTVVLDAKYDLTAALVNPGDPLRVQSCVTYLPLGASYPPGCFGQGGMIRSVKACDPLTMPACAAEQQTIPLTELMGLPASNLVTLSGFTASSASPNVSPSGTLSLTPGGAGQGYTVTRTGTPGTLSVVNVSGKVSCATSPACPAGTTCATTITNTAKLTPSPTWPAALGTPVSGSPATATIDATCQSATPPPIAVGDYCTYTQGGWGTACKGGNPGCFRDANFSRIATASVACGSAGLFGLLVGSIAPKQMAFTTSAAVDAYLPAGSTAGALTTGLLCNPTSTSAGVFGGQVTSLKLSVLFSDVGALPQKNGRALGDLVVKSGPCAGLTARAVLQRAEVAISGGTVAGTSCVSINDLNTAADAINNNFDNCTTNLGYLQ